MTDFTVTYPTFTLGPVSLTLAPGERVALVGPNGAGKSTTLQGLVGLLPAYEGSVTFEGQELRAAGAQVRGRIGVLPERVMGFGWMTVRQHLAFLAQFYPTWDAGYSQALALRLELPQDTRLANLSRGNGVKLSLVAAESYRPPVLLLDEPTSGLDPVMRTDVLGVIRECTRRDGDRAVLFSSHILEDIEEAADRVLMLREGRVLVDASVRDLQAASPGRPLSQSIRERLAHG